MKITKKLIALTLFASGLFMTSCSKDDDTNPLVGRWEADTLSYSVAGHSGTYPFNHEIFKKGCATDYITLRENKTVELKENNKNESGECADVLYEGTWNDQSINIKDANRAIQSINGDQLTLVYSLTFMGASTDVTVVYKRVK